MYKNFTFKLELYLRKRQQKIYEAVFYAPGTSFHCQSCHFTSYVLVSAAEFLRLQRVKDVLCNEETRRQYDRWRNCGISISFDDWTSRLAHHHAVVLLAFAFYF